MAYAQVTWTSAERISSEWVARRRVAGRSLTSESGFLRTRSCWAGILPLHSCGRATWYCDAKNKINQLKDRISQTNAYRMQRFQAGSILVWMHNNPLHEPVKLNTLILYAEWSCAVYKCISISMYLLYTCS